VFCPGGVLSGFQIKHVPLNENYTIVHCHFIKISQKAGLSTNWESSRPFWCSLTKTYQWGCKPPLWPEPLWPDLFSSPSDRLPSQSRQYH